MTASLVSTIPAFPVDAGTAPWAITDENVFGTDAAILRHDLPDGLEGDARRVEYLLPRRGLPIDFDGHEAIVNVDPAAVVRWSTFEDHVKAEVVFTGKPAVLELWFAVNFVGVTAEEDAGGVTLLDPDTGLVAAHLPAPYLLDSNRDRHELVWVLGDGCLTAALPDLDDDLWVGAVLDPTTIDTSTLSAATGLNNQRKIVRLSTGLLVLGFSSTGTNGEFWYSSDNGATWTQYTSGTTDIAGWLNGSVCSFLSSGGTEYIAVCWKQSGTGGSRTDGLVYVMVGSFDTPRTTITWGTTANIQGTAFAFDGDIDAVAHSTGGMIFVANTINTSTTNAPIGSWFTTSGTTLTLVNAVYLSSNGGAGYGQAGSNYCSVSINQATKDAFVLLSAGTTGSGKGMRWVKMTYGSGTYTLGTERALDDNNFAYQGRASSCFDGTRSVLAYAKSSATTAIEVLERDAGDTTSTSRTPPALSDGNVENVSVTYDANGNIWLFATGATSQDVKYVRYDRAGAAWGSWTTLVATTARADSLTLKRGSARSLLEVGYASGASSPYNVNYASYSLNTAPTAPTWTTTAGPKDVNASLVLAATNNDVDVGDTVSAQAIKRDIGGTVRYLRTSDMTWQIPEQKNTAVALGATLASGWGADGDANHSYYIKSWDAADAEGVYSAALVITPSVKVNPTIDSPANAGTVATSSHTATWTVAQQTEYLLELLDAAGTTVLWTAGGVPGAYVVDSAARSRTIGYTLANGTSYKLRLTTKNTEGLISDPDTNSFTVSYTPPATATLALNAVNSPGHIIVTVTNPAPTGSQPAIAHNEIYRRTVAEGDADPTNPGIPHKDGGAVANNGTFTDVVVGHYEDLEYKVLAVGVNGTTSWSAWTS